MYGIPRVVRLFQSPEMRIAFVRETVSQTKIFTRRQINEELMRHLGRINQVIENLQPHFAYMQITRLVHECCTRCG